MRTDYRDWLQGQGYAENTCNAQVARLQRIETEYGTVEDMVANGTYDKVFAELSYSTADERHGRPNPSRFRIDGNLRNNLASYKDALARYRRFLDTSAAPGVVSAVTTPEAIAPVLRRPTEPDPAEKQRLALERDMQTALRRDLGSLEPGLRIIDDGAERAVSTGFVDILAEDASGTVVVIELKAGRSDARVVGQTLGYMGDLMVEDPEKPVRGIIVAHEFDPRTRAAARAVPNLRLFRYAVSFAFWPED
jgi:hypothetical protein